jgi:hypothetical protein
MKIFIFGSCRVWNSLENINFVNIQNNNYRTLMHSISQYSQELDIINNKLILNPENYKSMYYFNYYTELLKDKNTFLNNLKTCVNNSDYILAEIQTLKYIDNSGIELDIVQSVRNAENHNFKYYNKTQFIKKVNEFILRLPNKKIIFVGHMYDDRVGITKINVRCITNKIMQKFANNKNIYFINPSNVFLKYSWKEIMKDSSHYTDFGEKIVLEYLKEELLKINQTC